MPFFHNIKQLVNQNSILQNLFDKSKWIVQIIPFYLVEERFKENIDLNLEPKINPGNLKVGLLGPLDMESISQNPEVKETKEVLLQRLKNDCLCLGIKFENNIIAYTWCNLKECDYRPLNFKLKSNEAYLADARTFSDYRGMNLAPFLRYQMYWHLQELGRKRLFSITEYFNTPAIKFKKKLQAKPLKLYLWINLFKKKFNYKILLKSY